jgi:hypothetical protein
MANPTLAESLDIIKKAQGALDALFARLEAASPAGIQPEEEAIRAAISAALAGFDLATAQGDIGAALEVVKSFGGIIGPGVGPDLA